MTGVSRLRAKESDRVESIVSALAAAGIGAMDADDAILITGAGKKHSSKPDGASGNEAAGRDSAAEDAELLPAGGEVDSRGDHRIAMLGALLSLIAGGPVSVKGAAAVRKSYPDFFKVFAEAGLAGGLKTDL